VRTFCELRGCSSGVVVICFALPFIAAAQVPPGTDKDARPTEALLPRFVDRGEVVLDTKTGLLWQKDGNSSGKLNFYQAADYAAKLKLGGLTGWRVGTKEELAEIFPATDPPFVNTMYTKVPYAVGKHEWHSYWTSTLDTSIPDYAYVYHWYAQGGANNCSASKNTALVRCVHDPAATDNAAQPVPALAARSSPPAAMLLRTGSLVVTSSDPNIELTVAETGRLLKITDSKTGQRLTVDTVDFAIIEGDGANRIQVTGDTIGFKRGAMLIAEIRRSAVAESPSIGSQSIVAPAAPTSESSRQLLSGAISPDGRLIVLACSDRTIRYWDAQSGQEVRSQNWGVIGSREAIQAMSGIDNRSSGTIVGVLRDNNEQVQFVGFLDDGREVFVASQRVLSHLDAKTGRVRRTSGGTFALVRAIALSTDGRQLVTGDRPSLQIRNTINGKSERALEHHMEVVNDVGFSTDGRRVFCAGGYITTSDSPLAEVVLVWDLAADKVLFELKTEVRTALRGALSPDGLLVAAPDTAAGGQLALWEVESGRRLRLLGTNQLLRQVKFSVTGEHLVSQTTDGTLRVFEVSSGRELLHLSEPGTTSQWIDFAPEGNVLLGSDGVVLRRWPLPISGREPNRKPVITSPASELRRIDLEQSPGILAFTSDGKRGVGPSTNSSFGILDLETGKQLQRHEGKNATEIVRCVAVSGDGRWALVGAGQTRDTQRLVLWDLRLWHETRVFEGLESLPACVAISRDGKLALCGMIDGKVRVWEIETGRQLESYSPAARFPRSLDVAPDGRMALYAGGSNDYQIRLWEVASGKELRLLSGHTGPVVSAAFLPDGKSIVSASEDRSIRVWDVESGREIRRIPHSALVRCMALSPDGQLVVVGSDDGTVIVWKLETRAELARYAKHLGQVVNVGIRPDSATIVSTSADRTIRFWPLPSSTSTGKIRSADPEVSKPGSNVRPVITAPSPTPSEQPREPTFVNGAQLYHDRAGAIRMIQTSQNLAAGDIDKFGDLSALQSLVCQQPVSDASLEEIKKLSMLKSLSLVRSKLTAEGLRQLNGLTKLESLDLFGGGMTDAGFAELKPFTKLQALQIQDSLITDDGLVYLAALPALTSLLLERSQVTGTGLAHLPAKEQLIMLSLRSSPITDEGLAQLEDFAGLTILQLSSCPGIGDEGLRHIGKLSRLQSLEISGTQITDIGLGYLKDLTRLQSLSVEKTNITAEGLKALEPLKRLTMLSLGELDVSDDAIQQLRQKLPQLKQIMYRRPIKRKQ
jgi:WD40 repeat protein